MPLIQSPSKKAFQKNVETEMKSNPGKENRARNLAISYAIQKKNKRKGKAMAKGGEVEITAEDEMRPMPDSEYADSAEAKRNKHMNGQEDNFQEDKMVTEDDEKSSRNMNMSHGAPMKRGQEEDFADESMTNIDKMSDERDMNMLDDKPTRHKEDITANDEPRANAYAKGGGAKTSDVDEHYESIADAIMAKKRKAKAMADGGEVDLESNAEEHGNYEDDLSFNALRKENYSEESALEDLTSPMDSNEHGHEMEDEKDKSIVGSIRSRMKMKRRG